jgi:hypothetical protein
VEKHPAHSVRARVRLRRRAVCERDTPMRNAVALSTQRAPLSSDLKPCITPAVLVRGRPEKHKLRFNEYHTSATCACQSLLCGNCDRRLKVSEIIRTSVAKANGLHPFRFRPLLLSDRKPPLRTARIRVSGAFPDTGSEYHHVNPSCTCGLQNRSRFLDRAPGGGNVVHEKDSPIGHPPCVGYPE